MMLRQNLNKKVVEEEFVILPDFCLHCDAEVFEKITEKDRFNTTHVITFKYYCGTILTSINHYGNKQPTTGHIVKIQAGCENAIIQGFQELNRGTLEDHRVQKIERLKK